jgi:PQQ-like domain
VKSVANWAQWRGPDSQGISPETGLPTVWSATQNVKWKTAIPGRGHSSPIVWGDRVFLTTSLEDKIIPGAKAIKHKLGGEDYVHPDSVGADRQHTLQVICLDRRSGKMLWRQTAYEGRVYDDRHRKATYADGTPATDGRSVYAWFGSEGLYCYDFNGKLIWKKSLGNIATQGMGNGTSPVLFENMVILQCDEDNGEKSFIAALDKRSGKELWRTPRMVERTSRRGRMFTVYPASLKTRSRCPAPARPAVSAAIMTTNSFSTPSLRSPIRARSSSTTSRRKRPRSSAPRRSISSRPITKRSKSSTTAKMERKSLCSSRIARG